VPITDNVNVLDSKDTNTAHLPKLKTRLDWMKSVPEEDGPATQESNWVIPPNELSEPENNWANALSSSYQDPDKYKLLRQTCDMSSFINWFCKWIRKKKLSKTNLKGSAFKADLEYLVSGDKGRRSALSISKLKAAHYLDFGLEELVLYLWIDSEREYDISAAYGISHWWFKHKEFYITRHDAPSNCSKVRSHMRILSVISLKTYERYGYAFLKEIVLRRADYEEHKILKADFKNLHPNDFEDRDRNDQKKMIRETEVRKFSDDTLDMILEKLDHMVKDFREKAANQTRILEALDYRVKEYRVNRLNPGSYKDGDGVNLFLQSQDHSHMLILKTKYRIPSRKINLKLPYTLISTSASICQSDEIMY
nr:hypothetical protein [Tanacetum cinerariifolium]